MQTIDAPLRRHRHLIPSALIALLYCGSSVPSPLYRVYQSRWHFGDAMLTGVFSVYAVTVVVSLLLFGPLSDRCGRRTLTAVGLAIVTTSMLAFLLAPNVAWLFIARALQGVGVGVAGAALTAAIVDSSPDDSTLGAVRATVWSYLGLGVGVLGSGLLVAYIRDPISKAFVALVIAFSIGLVASWMVAPHRVDPRHWPERRRTALGASGRSLRDLVIYGVGLAVSWAVGGLYLALGPSIASVVTRSPSRVSGAIAISSLGLVGALVAALGARFAAKLQVLVGAPALVAGLAVVVWACVGRSEPSFVAGSVLLASGWGLLSVGSFRAVVGLSNLDNRAAVISVAYLISYCAFSVPTILGGLAVERYGLRETTIVFGVVTALGATGAWVAGLRSIRRRDVAVTTPLAVKLDVGCNRASPSSGPDSWLNH